MNYSLSPEKSLIAPCGMNCGICLAHLRDKNSCKGCWGENTHKPNHCVKCVIKNCDLLARTGSKFCYECEKFPCPRLKQLDKRYRTNYGMSMVENLTYIQQNGLDEFIHNERSRWACKHCGGTICVHRGYCLNCNEKEALGKRL